VWFSIRAVFYFVAKYLVRTLTWLSPQLLKCLSRHGFPVAPLGFGVKIQTSIYFNELSSGDFMHPITEDEVALLHRYVCEGIGDPNRLRLLYLVAECPRNVTELTDALDVAQPTVSHHLRILRERGLVTTERDGTSIYYSLGDPRIIEAIEIMRTFVKDLMQARADAVRRS
jgi:ArsR family transcriptional regulator